VGRLELGDPRIASTFDTGNTIIGRRSMAFRGWDKIDHQVVGPPAIQSIAGSKGKEAAIDFWGASASIDLAAFIIILARGPDDRPYGSFGAQGPWVAVNQLKLESAPTVDNHLGKASGTKLLDVAAIADGGKVWLKIDGSANWRLLGGKAIGEAAIIARQCVFVRGVDDRLWAYPWEGQWTKVALMPTTPPAPGADASAGFAVDDGYKQKRRRRARAEADAACVDRDWAATRAP